jgi:hypothetical protein
MPGGRLTQQERQQIALGRGVAVLGPRTPAATRLEKVTRPCSGPGPVSNAVPWQSVPRPPLLDETSADEVEQGGDVREDSVSRRRGGGREGVEGEESVDHSGFAAVSDRDLRGGQPSGIGVGCTEST